MQKLFTLLLGLALIGTACGGSDESAETTSAVETDTTVGTTQGDAGDDTPDEDQGDQDSNDGGSNQGLPPGGTGTVTIDGETFPSDWVGNCEIDAQFDPAPGDLDLTASLGGLDALFLEISNRELAMGADPYQYMQVRPSLQLRTESGSMGNWETVFVTGPDGQWYEDEDGAAAFTFARGADPEIDPVEEDPLVLEDGRASGTFVLEGTDGPIEVSYDLSFVEAVDCSL